MDGMMVQKASLGIIKMKKVKYLNLGLNVIIFIAVYFFLEYLPTIIRIIKLHFYEKF